MLRHRSLHPLSHQHQRGLAWYVLVALVSSDPGAVGRDALIHELVAGHRKMERLAERLDSPADLRAFTNTLRGHIRREERELFEDIQQRLPHEVLNRLGRAFEAEAVRVCL